MASRALLLLVLITGVNAYPCCDGNVCPGGSTMTINGKTYCCPKGASMSMVNMQCECYSSTTTCPTTIEILEAKIAHLTSMQERDGSDVDQHVDYLEPEPIIPKFMIEPETRISMGSQNVTFIRGGTYNIFGKTGNGGRDILELYIEDRPFSWCSLIKVSAIFQGGELCWSNYKNVPNYPGKMWVLTVQSGRDDFECSIACFALEFAEVK
jgi:hypothetical protein